LIGTGNCADDYYGKDGKFVGWKDNAGNAYSKDGKLVGFETSDEAYDSSGKSVYTIEDDSDEPDSDNYRSIGDDVE
jgi:hypothetical protein